MVEIELAHGGRARVHGSEWTYDDPLDEAVVSAALDGRTFDPIYPHPDLAEAEAVIAMWGGRIVYSDPAPRHVPGRVY
jgi:hypothetical protein